MVIKSQIEKFKQQGQYPRITKNWRRYRQIEPSKCSTFRAKKVKDKLLTYCKLKNKDKWVLQSIGKPK